MRYRPELYARSLYESLETADAKDRDGIIKNFWRTVVKNGDESRIENIVKLFEELVVKNSGGKMVEVETARPLTAALDEKIKKLFGSKDVVQKSINSKLVAGIRIEVDHNKELDLSLATKFRKMFRFDSSNRESRIEASGYKAKTV